MPTYFVPEIRLTECHEGQILLIEPKGHESAPLLLVGDVGAAPISISEIIVIAVR